jgi:hypothetical protein
MPTDPCANVPPLKIDFNSDDYLYYNIPRINHPGGGKLLKKYNKPFLFASSQMSEMSRKSFCWDLLH